MRNVDSVSKSPIVLLYRAKADSSESLPPVLYYYTTILYTIYYTSYTYTPIPNQVPSHLLHRPKNTFPQLRRAVLYIRRVSHTKHKLNSGHQAKPSKPSKSNWPTCQANKCQANGTPHGYGYIADLGSEGKGPIYFT